MRATSNLLRIEQVLELLAVSKATLYRLIRRGELPAVKIGAATRFRAEDVQALIARLAASTPGQQHRVDDRGDEPGKQRTGP